MAYFLSGFPAGTITSTILPFFLALPFPIPSPFWSGFVSRVDPTGWVRRCLCGRIRRDVCPEHGDLGLTLAVLGPR